jgi:hypothetical protein
VESTVEVVVKDDDSADTHSHSEMGVSDGWDDMVMLMFRHITTIMMMMMQTAEHGMALIEDVYNTKKL